MAWATWSASDAVGPSSSFPHRSEQSKRERKSKAEGREEKRETAQATALFGGGSGVRREREGGARKGEGERWREEAGEAEAQRDGRADSGGAAWQRRAASRLRRGELEAGTAAVSAVRGELDGFDSDAPGAAAPVAAALARAGAELRGERARARLVGSPEQAVGEK